MSSIQTSNDEPPKLEMRIDITVLENLGLKMYTSLPAVLAEYVANSFDAGALEVNITIPQGKINQDYVISIEDNGFGMTVDEVNDKFLVVGRKKRDFDGETIIALDGTERKVIGRKGLGKIAGFGISGKVEIITRKDDYYIHFAMDYDKMQDKIEKEKEPKTTYPPEVVSWGLTRESNGTIVKLTNLKRTQPVRIRDVRRRLARHFGVIGSNFTMSVNNVKILPAERGLRKSCEYIWEFKDEKIQPNSAYSINGWIGTFPSTVPAHIQRGIVVFARGKLAQTPTTFDVGGTGFTGQHALSYLVGEIHAEFLDQEEDLISTGRRSVVWEVEPAATLRSWINDKIKEVARDWAKKRKEAKMKVIKELPVYSERIENLPKREKNLIDGLLGKMVDKEGVEEETIIEVANFLADGVEYKSFIELMKTMDAAEVIKPDKLLEFFREWEVFDAIDTIRIIEGRFNIIQKFQELISARALEVPTLHNFIADNPWILDPTWDYIDDEVNYRNKLMEMFPEADIPKENRRIDFLCLGYGNVLNVIELKRPGSTIGRKELVQIEDYCLDIKPLLGTDPKASYTTVIGYLIGGKISRAGDVREKLQRLNTYSIYVRTYDDLERIFWNIYGRFITILERKAKRIDDKRLLDGIKRLKSKYGKKTTRKKRG